VGKIDGVANKVEPLRQNINKVEVVSRIKSWLGDGRISRGRRTLNKI